VWLEILAGEHPAAARLGAWLDAHPNAAGLALLAMVAAYGVLCGVV
jgi:hypothetical protein